MSHLNSNPLYIFSSYRKTCDNYLDYRAVLYMKAVNLINVYNKYIRKCLPKDFIHHFVNRTCTDLFQLLELHNSLWIYCA